MSLTVASHMSAGVDMGADVSVAVGWASCDIVFDIVEFLSMYRVAWPAYNLELQSLICINNLACNSYTDIPPLLGGAGKMTRQIVPQPL